MQVITELKFIEDPETGFKILHKKTVNITVHAASGQLMLSPTNANRDIEWTPVDLEEADER